MYLQAPVDVLLERIARRGIQFEQRIGRRYLERLVESYARYFLEYDAAPVLIANAAEIDPSAATRTSRPARQTCASAAAATSSIR